MFFEWQKVPWETDVLVTHGPPMGIGDKTDASHGNVHVGCEMLMARVAEVKPLVHIFGHIHEGYGLHQIPGLDTIFLNVAILDEYYMMGRRVMATYDVARRGGLGGVSTIQRA